MIEFNHEEVQEFIDKLTGIIEELEEDLQEAQDIKDSLEGVAEGSAIKEYGISGIEIADYKNSIEFYEAIKGDLQEFLDEVDSQVEFTRDSNFKYDEELKTVLEEIDVETDDLHSTMSMVISDEEYSPFNWLTRGNFLHQNSPEERLIDSNEGILKEWAIEINEGIYKLKEGVEELDRLHELYFGNLTLTEYTKEHDELDGIPENYRTINSVATTVTSTMLTGVEMKSAYGNYKAAKTSNSKVGTSKTGNVNKPSNSTATKETITGTKTGDIDVSKNNRPQDLKINESEIGKNVETGTYPDKLPVYVEENWKYKDFATENYYKNQKVYENPKYFDQETGSINWPPNDGAVKGTVKEIKLKKGTVIDRYGKSTGVYTSPEGTPFSERALSPISQESEYHIYEVLKDFDVKSGEVLPWFDEIGGGIQYKSEFTVGELKDFKYIKEITWKH